MCKKKVIVPGMLVTGIMYMAVSGLLILLASSLAGNDQATLAYESKNIAQSVWLTLVAILLCPLACIGPLATREHNKFCLLIYFITTVVILCIMWGVAGSLSGFSNLVEEDRSVLKCLTYEREDDPFGENEWIAEYPEYRTPTCERIFTDHTMTKIRDLWVHLHDTALNDELSDSKRWNTFMTKLQSGEIAGGACCGFLRPGFCEGFSGEECFEEAQVKVEGEVYYPKNAICNQGRGGCIFDKPLGICAYGDLRPNTIGCAITFKNWLQGQMDTIASAVNVLSLVPLLGAIYSFCMIFKRKAEDVLPERYVKSALESEGEQGKMPA